MIHHDVISTEYLGDVIRIFLSNPLDRGTFKAFYTLCVRQTVGYLRFLQSQGWSLPIEKHDQENPLTDVAIDIQ